MTVRNPVRRNIVRNVSSYKVVHTSHNGGSAFSPSSLSNLRQYALDGGNAYESSTLDDVEYLRSLESYGDYRAPRQGRCWLFDGSDDYATRARVTSGTLTQLTVCGWYKTSTGSRALAAEYGSAGNRTWLLYHFAGQIWINLSGDGTAVGYYNSNAGTFANGQWRHVAFVYNAGVVVLYVDGVAVAGTADTIPTSLFNSTASFNLGGNVAGVFTLNGSMADWRVYNVSKTAGEVAAIYNQSGTGNGAFDTAGLLAAYACNEESGTTGYDISDNGNHLTLTNITQATFHATDTEVTANRNNSDGYRLSSGVYIPKRLSDGNAADGNALTATGKAPYPVRVDTPCVTGNGSDAYVNLGGQFIPLSGDFEISLTAYIPSSDPTNYSCLLGQSDNQQTWASSFQMFWTGGSWYVSYGSYTTNVVAIGLNGNAWNDIRIRKVGTTLYVSANGGTESSVACAASITGEANTIILGSIGPGTPITYAGTLCRVTDFRITADGVTKYFPLQDGPGSSNTNRNVAWVASDGTGGVISNAIVNGTVANIWANRCPGQAKDWCIENGGGIAANGAFVPGIPDSANDAAGNTKTLAAGKFGNPYSRINFNPFTAAELNGLGLETAYAESTARQSVSPTDTKFRRTAASGDDRFFATDEALTGADLTNAENYVS